MLLNVSSAGNWPGNLKIRESGNIVVTLKKKIIRRSVVFAFLSFFGLVIFYLGVVSAVESWAHAVELVLGDIFFVGAIALGLGIQVGLFSYTRQLKKIHYQQGAGLLTATGTGTGTSTVSMVACCLHHVGDVLPFVGLSAATIFFEQYRYPLMWSGVTINFLGILIMIHIMNMKRFWPRQVFSE